MKRFLPSLRPRQLGPTAPVALQVKGDLERRATSGGPYIAQGVPYRTSWSPERAVQDGLERVTWVYRCVDSIASDESRLPIVWREGHPEDGDEIKPSAEPLWKLLNRRANPFESAQAFRYRLSTQLLLCKQGVFVEIQRNKAKEIIGLYLLPPHRTAPIPDPDTFLWGYEVYGSMGEIYRLPAEQVLWIRRSHPLDPYMGLIPMEAAGLAVDVDFYARLYNRNFLLNDGRPGGIVNVKGFLSDEDADELETRFSGGPGRAGKITVLESDGVEFVDTSVNARDMQHADTRAATKKEIQAAFGVPETRCGDSSGRTFDNADAEIEGYWRDTMRAHLDLIDAAFDSLTAGGIEDDIFTAHDTRSIYVLNRDEKDKEQRFQNLWNAGLITVDEFRKATGREPLGRPGSKVVWVTNSGKLPVGDEADEKAMMEAASGGGMAAPPGAPGADAGAGADPGAGGSTDWGTADQGGGQGDQGGGQGGDGYGGNGSGSGNGNGSGGGQGGIPSDLFPEPGFDWNSWGNEAVGGAGGGGGKKWGAYDVDLKVGGGDGAALVIPRANGAPDAPPTDTPPLNNGIMVSIDVPDRTARAILDTLVPDSPDTEAPDDLHITLVYLGKVDPAPSFCIDDVLEAVDHFAALSPPIVLAVSGIGHFAIPEGTATYASVDCPDLPSFRQRLVGILQIKDVASPSEHGFSPHITLAYTPPGTEPPDVPIEELSAQLAALTFPIAEVTVHWGDDVYRFPLQGERKALVHLGTVETS